VRISSQAALYTPQEILYLGIGQFEKILYFGTGGSLKKETLQAVV
jgi:hypothetical protein